MVARARQEGSRELHSSHSSFFLCGKILHGRGYTHEGVFITDQDGLIVGDKNGSVTTSLSKLKTREKRFNKRLLPFP